jgi:4-amino-4-deoxy-L-arabinose transferase-like glycosyltransferase
VLGWAALRTWFYIGDYFEDAPGFVADAANWAAGDWQARSHLPGLRVGTYLPAGVAIWLLGRTEFAISAWPLLSSLVGLLALIGISRRLLSREWTWLAAALWIAYPGDIIFSTVLMPDAIQTGWLLAAIFLVMCGSANPRIRTGTFCAAGVAFGLCYLVRENAVLMLPALLAGAALLPWPSPGSWALRARAVGALLAGLLIVVTGEALFYWYELGAPFHRFQVSHAYYGGVGAIPRNGLNADWWTIPESLLPPIAWLRSHGGIALNPNQAYHSFLFVLGVAAWLVGCASWRRLSPDDRRRFLFLSCWMWVPVLYHQFGSQSVTAFVPMHRLPRQLVLYAPAAALITAWCASRVSAAVAPRSVAMKLAAVSVLVGALALHGRGVVEGLRLQLEIVRQTMSIHDRLITSLTGYAGRIFVDSAEAGALDYFLNPSSHDRRVLVSDLLAAPSCDALAGAVVVTNSNPGWAFDPPPEMIGRALERLPCLRTPPRHWQHVVTAPWLPERIYSVPPASAVRATGQELPAPNRTVP